MMPFIRAIFGRFCNSFLLRLRFDERGGAAVETALLLPLIVAGGLLCVDLFKVGIERTRMEQLAGSAAITLSVQQKLGKAGLDGLYETLFKVEGLKDVRGRHQMVVSNVTMPSRRIWWSLSRGGDGVCAETAREGTYEGTLPVDAELDGNGDPENDTHSLIVVRLCRTVDDISMEHLALPDRLAVVSVNRALATNVDLDEVLLAEAVGAIVQEERE
ncbi:TadE/TadG family type IV pilus assembly protein [Corticimicrobacter populi]|uniref:Uncharacterized protein n=1 Tax=Corticimicrobacter populi TaxID=2175229 RepID=A0A2V1JTZ2_9BURK|nr:hypothetical protein [Corticimicrobacter populi]PWF21461.1 hypothetical protein DD235_14400 [Corticimicrobacter populi]